MRPEDFMNLGEHQQGAAVLILDAVADTAHFSFSCPISPALLYMYAHAIVLPWYACGRVHKTCSSSACLASHRAICCRLLRCSVAGCFSALLPGRFFHMCSPHLIATALSWHCQHIVLALPANHQYLLRPFIDLRHGATLLCLCAFHV